MKKKLISMILVFVLTMSLVSTTALAYRDLSVPEQKAAALKSLNLFQGVSENDFALERAPTRIEALVMFVRLIGAEDVAMSANWTMPFTDVPNWARSYVGYAYTLGYTYGVSPTKFGTNDTAGAAAYLTFVLRALGYSDGTNGDFTWSDPYTLSRNIGLLTDDVDTYSFLRADVALISWNALSLPMNGGNKALADILIIGGIFTSSQFDTAAASVGNGSSGNSDTDDLKIGKYICYEDSYGQAYDAAYRPSVTLSSDNSCTVYVNMGEGMATGKGTWHIEIMDSGEIGLHLKITTKSWSDSPGYSFTYYNNQLILSDGGMGITPVESAFSF